jgi:UDPglucose 6-dehydrogenase
MKVCVFGLWHLGTVTAACLADMGHAVTGLDFDGDRVARLAQGTPPLFEPGLEPLVGAGLARGTLRVTGDAVAAVHDAEVVWITMDTPVDEEDRADVDAVVHAAARLFPHLRDGCVVVISSQLPVGTTARLEGMFAAVAGGRIVGFACVPENLRLGAAIDVFMHPDRVVAGVRGPHERACLIALLPWIADRIVWMSVESAEMTKHAINAFLATSVSFINEIAAVCEQVGADAAEVEGGLKSDARIGPKAYLSPGGAFAGGTLARDVVYLAQLGRMLAVPVDLLAAVQSSNERHRDWPQRRLTRDLDGVRGRTIAVWGLTYKPGTDTLRRSAAVSLCVWLEGEGARVRAHDPAVRGGAAELPAAIEISASALDAVDGADALVVSTAWPEYRAIPADAVRKRMAGTLVVDANRFLAATLGADAALRYVSVGKAVA